MMNSGSTVSGFKCDTDIARLNRSYGAREKEKSGENGRIAYNSTMIEANSNQINLSDEAAPAYRPKRAVQNKMNGIHGENWDKRHK